MLDVLFDLLVDMKTNEISQYCMDKQKTVASREVDWNTVAGCQSKLLQAQTNIKDKEMADFLVKNPHYRYPGQALPNGRIKPRDRCWGKNRVYTLEGRGCR